MLQDNEEEEPEDKNDEQDGEEEFEVEHIRDRQIDENGQVMYLVKWVVCASTAVL